MSKEPHSEKSTRLRSKAAEAFRDHRDESRSEEDRRVDLHVAESYKRMAENTSHGENEVDRAQKKREKAIDVENLNSSNDT